MEKFQMLLLAVPVLFLGLTDGEEIGLLHKLLTLFSGSLFSSVTNPKGGGQWFNIEGAKVEFGNTLTVTTILEKPFTMMSDTGELEGYCVDLLSELSKSLQFNYTLHVVKDGRYGAQDENGGWNGMIGEVIRKEADLAVAPLTITAAREKAVSFTKPFIQTGIGILMKRDGSADTSYLFAFLSPFSKELWIGIIISYVVTTICLFLVGRLSPWEWSDPSSEQNQYTFLNSLWFGMGAFTLQGVEPQAKSVSGRIISVIWWLFSITLVAAYIASFASYLNSSREEVTNIQSFSDLLKQSKFEFGTMNNSSTFNFFKNSKNPTFQLIYEYMEKRKNRVLVHTFAEGVERVRKSNYVLLGESISMDFIVAKHCDLVRAPEVVAGRGYGIAAFMDSPLIRPLTFAILEHFESGNLEYLRQKWWDKTCVTEMQGGWSPVQASTMGGIFLILGIGLALGLVVSCVELVCKAKISGYQQKKPCCTTFSEEIGQRFGKGPKQEECLEKAQP